MSLLIILAIIAYKALTANTVEHADNGTYYTLGVYVSSCT